MRAKGEDKQGEIFSTYDEFKRKVDRTVTTTTQICSLHASFRVSGGVVGRLGFRVGVSASYSKAVWLISAFL